MVLYPYDELEVNPFNSSTELRRSLTGCRVPESKLAGARRVEVEDAPGDVVIFRGHAIWHQREDGAGTAVLAGLPAVLTLLGTGWNPGRRRGEPV